MSETITFHALDLAGETGLKLYLRKNDGSLLNTGGDAFSDLGSSGVFVATLAESRVGLGTLHARICEGTETADNSLFEEFLPESETVIGATGVAVLNSEYLFDDGLGGLAIKANVTHYQGTLQGNGDLPSKLDTIKTVTNKIDTGLVEDGAVYQFTANMLELGPSGSGGGGDATLANQEEMIGLLEDLADVQLAAVAVASGTISGFPEELIIGDSYDENTGQIRVNITDSTTGDPIDSLGSLDFADADIAFTAFRPNDSARISGTCEYVREPSSGTLTASYVLITLLTTETALGKAEYTYEGRLKFVWQGPSSSDDSDETQKTYKTTPFKFIANP